MILKQRLNESSLSRLWSKYHEFDSGTISACRGNLTSDENKKRTLQLKTDLMKLGHSVTAVKGVYKENYGQPDEREVHEDSFIVFDQKGTGNLKKDLMDLGAKYDQDSITYTDRNEYYLIGTNKTGYPGMNKEVKLGKPMFGKNGEFFSSINGRPFVFESVGVGLYDYDCVPTSYNISTNMCLKKMPDFILSE